MPFFDAVRLALAQIRVQKLKSFFTVIGVMIGVMFLIAVVSIVEGMGHYMEHELVGKLLPVNTFELRHRPNLQMGDMDEAEWQALRRRQRLTVDDVAPVVEALPAGVRWSMQSQDEVPISSRYAIKPKRVMAFAVDGDYFGIKKMAMASGRAFSRQEIEMGALVVVIGLDVQKHFFPTVDPIGREIKVGGIPYTVVGIAEPQGGAFGMSFDKFIVAPWRAPIHRLLNRRPDVIDAVVVQAPTAQALPGLQEEVRQVMRQRHHLRPGQRDDFSIETSATALEFWNKIKKYLVLAGVALPAIGIVVGAIVIMNIMLVAVAERTREIGIRKSLGARRRDIMAQFLVESATLSTVGAAIGVAMGLAIAGTSAATTFLPARAAPWSIVVGVLLGAGVGVISGAYPASRASRLDPITALRQE